MRSHRIGPRMPSDDHHAAPPGSDAARLEEAHHEICTALTILWSNVELVRHDLQAAAGASARIDAHLGEVDEAMARLRRVARELRRWHDVRPSLS